MLTIQDKQFRLNDTGQILFQPDSTNPLPGTPVAQLGKGEALLAPVVTLLDGPMPPMLGERDAALARINQWKDAHFTTVIGALTALGSADAPDADTPVADISRKLYGALGIVPRAEIDAFIEKLDQDGRRDLRNRRVRLGPVLVSMPDMNKPAAVRLRALLLTLWNDKPLPAAVPPDGMVSLVVDPEAIDADYYRAIGYPVYAKRAIRVDMLDRVISAIYDNADKGVFKAKHEMAEWLGCPIAELYDILTAMGHTKIHDPADEPKLGVRVEEVKAEEAKAEEAAPAAEAPKTEDSAPVAETAEEGEAAKPPPAPKPELATFRLRRGRAHEDRAPREKRERHFGKPKFKGGAHQDGENKDGEHKGDRKGGKPYDKNRKRDDDREHGGKRHDGPRHKKHGRDDKRDRDFSREPRIVASAEAKKNEADSPFAILQQLKAGRKE